MTEYWITHVPEPPPLSVTPVKSNVVPTQTFVAFGDLVAVGAKGSVTTVQVYSCQPLMSQPLPLQFLLILMRLVPTTAVKLGTEVDTVDQVLPLFVENWYSKEHVPVPPEPNGFISVIVAPAHTTVASGDFVAVGVAGSALTVHE